MKDEIYFGRKNPLSGFLQLHFLISRQPLFSAWDFFSEGLTFSQKGQ